MGFHFLAFFMPGERYPEPRAAEAAIRAARADVLERLTRAESRLDGLYALLETEDGRDAGLVATLLAEDLDAAGKLLDREPGLAMVDARAMLGPLPEPEVLAGFAARAEARLTVLREALAGRIAGKWRTSADRFSARAVRRARVVLLVGVVLLAGGILLGDSLARKWRVYTAAVTLERQQQEAVATLEELGRLAERAKRATGKPLWAITGKNCSRCGCQGRDLRLVPAGDVCVRQWEAALSRIGQAAGASPRELAKFARDPWGAPYLLNENEGESPDFPCEPDTFATAGQNGLAGDGDDSIVAAPNAFCPK